MHLNVVFPKCPVEQRAQLCKNLTETVANVLNLPMEVRRRISIRLDMFEMNETARGGQLLSAKEHQMYHIDLFSPGLSEQHKRELVRHLTTAFCDSLGVAQQHRDDVFITIHQFKPEDVATGGRLMADLAHV